MHVDNCISATNKYRKVYPNFIFTKISEVNLGAAVSVLSACDWVFDLEEFAVIIEDDCLPTGDFFTWIRDSQDFLVNDKNTLLVSGNQFAPPEITRNIPTLSKYPLIWGWATSKTNWKIIVSLMQDIKKINKMARENSYIEYCFWRSGARRSLEGYIDAWDIPLAFIFYQIGAKTLLPAYNLVSNTGGDKHATHTKEFTKWLKFPTNNYIKSESKPIQNIEQDLWYRKNVFEIKFRHVFSTKISWLLDRLGVRKKSRSNLMDRIFFKFY
jgi:hypothetical protein